ncbi:MAG: (Fe-S)-binding protein [Desulfobacula sp.]|jgi:glycolate oxidase iron-sulfur subunit|nr:(Fe-S)-binding protein [Desulfobacula sp.]
MNIFEDYDAISQCNKCGFCQEACPVFRSTGHESGVARGRLALMRGIIEDRVQWTKELEDPLFNCLGCGACTASCLADVPTADLVIKGRAQYLEKVGRKPIHKLLFEQLLPYPKRLHMAARAAALGKNSGMSKVVKALGLLRILGRDFAKAENIVEKLPPVPFRGLVKPGEYPGTGETLRIGYFIGCGVDVIQQAAGHESLKILKKIGKTVTVLDNCCCGLPAWTYGDIDAAQKLALKNLEAFSSQSFDVIVTDCSSCASFLKKYPKVFQGDEKNQDLVQAQTPLVQDMVEFIFKNGYSTPPSKSPIVVTYHDPCHAVRGQGISKENREILKNIQGVEFREMPEADWCCGGAGSYALTHYDLSMKVLDRKMKNVESTEADFLVTSCPACMIQLSHGVRRAGLKTKVCHISEIVTGAKPKE